MAHCRWVVVAEESYNQLCDQAAAQKTPEKEDKSDEPLDKTSPVKPLPESTRPSDVALEETPLTVPKETVTPDTKDNAKLEDQGPKTKRRAQDVSPVHGWILDLPTPYRPDGLALLRKFEKAGGLTVGDTGNVSIDTVPVDGFTISDLLRITCIPGNPGVLPNSVQEWLRCKKLVRFRNPKANLRPEWVNRYSWRESTMATRQARSAVPPPSTSRRKRKAT